MTSDAEVQKLRDTLWVRDEQIAEQSRMIVKRDAEMARLRSEMATARVAALREAAALHVTSPGFIDETQRRVEEYGADLLRAEIRRLADAYAAPGLSNNAASARPFPSRSRAVDGPEGEES